MTEKRFTILNMGLDGKFIKEDEKIMEIDRIVNLLNENEQLKERIKELETRNNRQYERLNEITNLMFKRDWETLETMVDEWEQAEEQLEREWGTYGGMSE